MNEKWAIWNPSSLITKDYYMGELKEELGGFSILFYNRNKKKSQIKMSFGAAAEFYRVCNERSRLRLYDFLIDNYGKDFLAKNNYFQVQNSKLIKWLKEESNGLMSFEAFSLKHYTLMNQDYVLDIITYSNPTVESIK